MKKAFTTGEKWLFASPLLFLFVAALAWQRQKTGPIVLPLPDGSMGKILEYSPDSKRVVVSYQDTKSWQFTSRVYDLETRSVVCELDVPPSLDTRLNNRRSSEYYYQWMTWSGDGKSLVGSGSSLGTNRIAIWDAQSGAVKADYPSLPLADYTPNYGAFRFSSDGKTLVGGGKPLVTYEAATGKLLSKPSKNVGQFSLEKSSEKLGVFTTFNNRAKSFQVVDSKTKRVVWEPKITEYPDLNWFGDILCVKSDSSRGSDEREGENWLLLWNGRTRQPLPSPPILAGAEVGDCSFNSDHHTLAYYQGTTTHTLENEVMVEHTKGELVAYDYRKNAVLWRTTTNGVLEGLQWSPDGKYLATLGNRGPQPPLYVFDKGGKLRFEREAGIHNYIVRWSPDSKQLASVVGEVEDKVIPRTSRLEIERFED